MMQPYKTMRGSMRACSAAALLAALAACGSEGEADSKSGQVVAQVNDAEVTIHQLNARLQGVQLPPGADVKLVQKRALEGLIDEEVAYQAALKENVDRDPTVMQKLEMARRGIIAQSYLERQVSATTAPSLDAERRFFDENPGLFSQRRQYQLAEVVVRAPENEARPLQNYFNGSGATLDGLVQRLRQAGSQAAVSTATRNSEDLPLGLVPAFLKMNTGDKAFYRAGDRVHFIEVRGIQPAPVSFELARPRIEAFLRAQNQGKAAQEQIAALRKDARIEYKGGFAAPKPVAEPAQPAPAQAKANDAVARGVKGL